MGHIGVGPPSGAAASTCITASPAQAGRQLAEAPKRPISKVTWADDERAPASAAPSSASHPSLPAPGAARAPRAIADAATNFEVVRSLGIVDALTSTHAPDVWLQEPSDAERAQAARLRLRLSEHAAVANATTYHAELANALNHLRTFVATMPHRQIVRRYVDEGDSMYNAETRGTLFEHIRESGSLRGGAAAGKRLKSDSISGVLSTLFAYFERLARGPLHAAGALAQLDAARKHARHEDGPAGDRAVAQPLRAAHLRTAFADPDFDTTSDAGVIRCAGLLFGHNVLARARCLSANADGSIDPSRDLTVASFDWHVGQRMSPPAVVAWLHPSKDPTQRKKRYPMLVQRRATYEDCPSGGDPMCTYDALLAAHRIIVKDLPRAAWSTTLFFQVPVDTDPGHRTWRPLRATDVTQWVCEAAEAAGLPAGSRGSRAIRMGGASDMYDIYGPAGERFIRERGRWGSDIAQIYQRVSASAHGEISRKIGDSSGTDLQSMLAGWSQLSISHGRYAGG